MSQLITEVKQIPPCFHGATGYFSMLLAPAQGSGTMGWGIEGANAWMSVWLTDCRPRGEGSPMRTHTHAYAYLHSHTTHGYKRAQEQTRLTHTQKCAPTNTYFNRPPTTHHKHKRTRTHTPLPLMHAHHTQARNTRAINALRAHAYIPCTHPPAHAHIPCTGSHRARTFTPRAHALAHTPTLARTRSRGEGGAGRERPPVP